MPESYLGLSPPGGAGYLGVGPPLAAKKAAVTMALLQEMQKLKGQGKITPEMESVILGKSKNVSTVSTPGTIPDKALQPPKREPNFQAGGGRRA